MVHPNLETLLVDRNRSHGPEARGTGSVLVQIAVYAVILFVGTSAFADYPTTILTTQPTKPASPELLDKVQKDLSTVTTVESDFVQEKEMAMMNHKLIIKGHFALEKPDRVVWIVNSPVKYAISVHGEEVRQWDEDSDKVQVIHLGGDPTFKAISDQINAWFIGDYKALAGNFDVFVVEDAPLTLGFVPKSGSMVGKMLGQINVTFGREGKYIDKMVIREASGSVTTLQYVGVHINEPVKKELWEIPPHDR